MSALYQQTIARLYTAYDHLSRAVHQALGATLTPGHPLHAQDALAQALVPLLAAGLAGRARCAPPAPPTDLVPWGRTAFATLPPLQQAVACAFARAQAADGERAASGRAAIQAAEVPIATALARVNELLLVLVIWEDADPGPPPAAAALPVAAGVARESRP